MGKRVLPFYKFLFFLVQIVFWAGVTFYITFYIAKKTNLANQPFGVSDLILLITAAFILFYTYETQKMRKQAESAKEAEFMPTVIFSPEASNSYDMNKVGHNHRKGYVFHLELKNVGKGIAKEVYIFFDGHSLFEKKLTLEATGTFPQAFIVNRLPEEIIQKFEKDVDKFNVRLEYEDIFGNMFYTESTFEKKDHSYRISSRWDFSKL